VLLKAGALDSLADGLGRVGMAWYIRAFGNDDGMTYTPARLHNLPCGDVPESTRLAQEIAALGFPVSFHPLHLYRDRIAALKARLLPAAGLRHHIGKRVTLVGWPIAGKSTCTRRGEPMEFISLEDETDTFEATFFPNAYRKFCRMVSFSRPLVLAGIVEEQFSAISVSVEQVGRL